MTGFRVKEAIGTLSGNQVQWCHRHENKMSKENGKRAVDKSKQGQIS